MKNRRALIFAVVCGVMAVLLTGYYISRQEKELSQAYEKVPVLVATKVIPRYQQIDESMLGIREVPLPYVQPKAITAKDRERLIGYVADSTIEEGEQITDTKIAHAGETRISNTIPKGERACTIAVDEVNGVAGLIRPGDHVDVVGTFRTVDEKSRIATAAESVTLLQNVPILATGRNYTMDSAARDSDGKPVVAGRDLGGFSNVTVSLTPRQCMDVTLAQQVGVITLTLRSFYNRLGGDSFSELKDKRSTAASVTGIQVPLEISRRPKWLEMRGEQTVFAP